MTEQIIQILVIVAIFAVLIILVLKGKLGSAGGKGSQSEAKEGLVDEAQAKKYGPVEKVYLLASDSRNYITYEVYYQSGKSATEKVKIYSPRYETLKAKELKRLHLNGSWGNSIEIVYEDGRVVDCACAWASFEAAELREQMLKQNVPAK